MAIRTLKDVGSEYPIPSEVDGAVYSLINDDCVIAELGDEFLLNYNKTSLVVSFAKGSQAVLCGNAFWLESEETVELPANSTVYLCARINPLSPNGQRGTFECLTESGIKYGNVNNGEIRDLLLYVITTNNTSVISVVDKRNIVNNADSYVKGTLPSGSTSLTLYSRFIKSTSLLSFYTSIYGVAPKAPNVESGKVTLTFDAQTSDMDVVVKIERK